jgi:uncharacterized cupredoxin-like copper-binding protein
MSLRRTLRRVGLGAVLVAALVFIGGAVVASTAAPVEIGIRHSRFSISAIRVQAGEPVTILLRNDDPIDHEWIVGSEALHDRHRTGTEPIHDARPTEVTVPALSSRTTTVVFPEPGTYRFICHLPGHEAYGMVGVVQVVDGG